MGAPTRKSPTTRRMVKNVREKGFMEKRDLSENLINETPNLRVSGFRCQEVSIGHGAWNKESGVRSQNPGGKQSKSNSSVVPVTRQVFVCLVFSA